MAAVLWGSSSRIFSETQKRQEESTKNAVLKGAVQCYAVEGRYPESLSYLEQNAAGNCDRIEREVISVERQKHMVDKMFLILLFATFAVCAFTLIMVGANVYSHTASAMNDNYEKRIDISYVTEKIKQWDEQNSISIGTFHNKTALIHTEVAAGRKYYTYIYQENGALRELMVREGLHTEKMQGEQIVPAKGFEIKEEDQMYDITITGEDGKQYRTCVYRQSRE